MQLFKVPKQDLTKRTLADKFIVPPFSVFNTHQSYWKQRQKYWLDMGIGGTNGRITSNNGLSYDNRRMDKYAGKGEFNGTSAFSPVLCEVVYKWFTTPNSKIFDPFAGGIVRGAMASIMGFDYTGLDISAEQCQSNRQEYEKFLSKFTVNGSIQWINADSTKFNSKENMYPIL